MAHGGRQRDEERIPILYSGAEEVLPDPASRLCGAGKLFLADAHFLQQDAFGLGEAHGKRQLIGLEVYRFLISMSVRVMT